MPSQIRISFAVSAEQDKKIKALSKANGQNISEFCRDRVTGDMPFEELNPVTLENRIEKLEKESSQVAYSQLFLTRLIYHFLVLAKDEKDASEAWNMAKEELDKL